jgi:hypothetical protein
VPLSVHPCQRDPFCPSQNTLCSKLIELKFVPDSEVLVVEGDGTCLILYVHTSSNFEDEAYRIVLQVAGSKYRAPPAGVIEGWALAHSGWQSCLCPTGVCACQWSVSPRALATPSRGGAVHGARLPVGLLASRCERIFGHSKFRLLETLDNLTASAGPGARPWACPGRMPSVGQLAVIRRLAEPELKGSFRRASELTRSALQLGPSLGRPEVNQELQPTRRIRGR